MKKQHFLATMPLLFLSACATTPTEPAEPLVFSKSTPEGEILQAGPGLVTAKQEVRYKNSCKRYSRFSSQVPAVEEGREPPIVCRIPPQFPDACQATAKSTQFVRIKFDVSPTGQPDNLMVVETDNPCVVRSALRSLLFSQYEATDKWWRDLETTVTFQLG